MKHACSVFALAALCLALPAGRAEAGGFQLNEHGARAMAQAGAFAARANDPSALFFNPAGMSFLRGTRLMLGTTLISPRYSFYGPYNLNSNQEWQMNANNFFPVNGYLTHTVTDGAFKGLAAGIGVNNPFGLGTEWPDDWAGEAITREASLTDWYITPSVSYKITDMVSVGVGVNVVYGSVKLRRAVTNFDPVMNLELDGSGTGIGWNAGVLVHPSDNVSFGACYRSSAKVDYSGTADFHPPASLAAQFPGGDVSTSITNPATYFIGAAWRPFDDLAVEFDYQGIDWSSFKSLTIDFAKDASNDPAVFQQDATQEKNYKNTFILRFGAEYNTGFIGLKLRAGYEYDHNPVPDATLEPMLPDADRHGVTFGFGMKLLPNLTMDVAYMHLFFLDRETTATTQPGGVYFNGLYRGSANLAGVDFTYTWD